MEELKSEITMLETKKKEYEDMLVHLEEAKQMLLKAKEKNSNIAEEIVVNYVSETASKKAEEIEDNSVSIEQVIIKIKNMILEIESKIQSLKVQIEEAKVKLASFNII